MTGGEAANYFPDFYLPEFNAYVEVKGYETEQDHAKWKCFPEKLLVMRQKEMTQIQYGTFDINVL